MTHYDWIDFITKFIAVCSILHTILPPWEAFNDYPAFQKFYRLIIYLLGYAALNGRSAIHPEISTKDGTQLSEKAVETIIKKNGGCT